VHGQEKADFSGKLRLGNDNRDIFLVALLSSSGAMAQTRAALAPDAMPALVDALPAEACWRDGSAEDARRSRHPWPWWAE
jgi:hypothetical protein